MSDVINSGMVGKRRQKRGEQNKKKKSDGTRSSARKTDGVTSNGLKASSLALSYTVYNRGSSSNHNFAIIRTCQLSVDSHSASSPSFPLPRAPEDVVPTPRVVFVFLLSRGSFSCAFFHLDLSTFSFRPALRCLLAVDQTRAVYFGSVSLSLLRFLRRFLEEPCNIGDELEINIGGKSTITIRAMREGNCLDDL